MSEIERIEKLLKEIAERWPEALEEIETNLQDVHEFYDSRDKYNPPPCPKPEYFKLVLISEDE